MASNPEPNDATDPPSGTSSDASRPAVPADASEATAMAQDYPPYRFWVFGLAVLLVLSTFTLVTMGGHVTSKEAGMAVPEAFYTGPYWSLISPLEYWWYDSGRRLEHLHRLKGYVVGFCTIGLMAGLLATQRGRRWVKVLAVALLVFVVLQGVMGILRVRLNHVSWVTGSTFAAIHGVTGQVFLCLTVLAAAAVGKFWMNRPTEAVADPTSPPRHRKTLRVLPLLLIVALLGQLSLGSAVRHSKSALAIPDWPTHYGQLMPPMSQGDIDTAIAEIPVDERHPNFAPPKADEAGNLLPGGYAAWQVHLHFTHRVGAYVIFGFGVWYVAWLWRQYAGQPAVLFPATLFGGLLVLQVALGVFTVLSSEQATLATAHQTTGAALIATATWLTIRLHLLPKAKTRPAHIPVGAGDAVTEVFRKSSSNLGQADASAPPSTASRPSPSAPPQPEPVEA